MWWLPRRSTSSQLGAWPCWSGHVADELLAGGRSAVQDMRSGPMAFSQSRVQENAQVVPDGADGEPVDGCEREMVMGLPIRRRISGLVGPSNRRSGPDLAGAAGLASIPVAG